MFGRSLGRWFRGRHRGRVAVYGVLVAAVLTGVIGMHGLTAPAYVVASVAAIAHGGGPHESPHGDGDHGSHHGGHAGPVCQSSAVLPGHHEPVLPPAVDTAPAQPAVVLPTGTADAAAGGTGCGPPSVYALSVLRL